MDESTRGTVTGEDMWVQDGVQEISLLVKLVNWLQAPVEGGIKGSISGASTGSTDTVGRLVDIPAIADMI
jgi:hypothetical protein